MAKGNGVGLMGRMKSFRAMLLGALLAGAPSARIARAMRNGTPMSLSHETGSGRYGYHFSKQKTLGVRDASQRSRSNRRKAAR